MNQMIAKQDTAGEAIERVIAQGDLSKLSPEQRIRYYNDVCKSLDLNPLTRPFEYITLSGKLVLYARKDATEQLRVKRGISLKITAREKVDDVYLVTAQATDKTGRVDESIGAVTISGLKGDAMANAVMKCETKAKRRVTLSISGLGFTDESELETIPDARPVRGGNPLRHEFAAFATEIDGAKSQEQIDLVLGSPEFVEFERRDEEQAARGGVGFAGMLRDKADQLRRKLPPTVALAPKQEREIEEYKDAAQSRADVAPSPVQSFGGSERGQGQAAEPSPDDLLSEETTRILDRIDVAESEKDLKAISADVKGMAIPEAEKPIINKAYKQRKQTIAAKEAA